MVTFLILTYVLICGGFMFGTLIDNDEISYLAKTIMILFAIIIAPIFFGIAIGRIIISMQPK